jgi:hypothetical protein
VHPVPCLPPTPALNAHEGSRPAASGLLLISIPSPRLTTASCDTTQRRRLPRSPLPGNTFRLHRSLMESTPSPPEVGVLPLVTIVRVMRSSITMHTSVTDPIMGEVSRFPHATWASRCDLVEEDRRWSRLSHPCILLNPIMGRHYLAQSSVQLIFGLTFVFLTWCLDIIELLTFISPPLSCSISSSSPTPCVHLRYFYRYHLCCLLDLLLTRLAVCFTTRPLMMRQQ